MPILMCVVFTFRIHYRWLTPLTNKTLSGAAIEGKDGRDTEILPVLSVCVVFNCMCGLQFQCLCLCPLFRHVSSGNSSLTQG